MSETYSDPLRAVYRQYDLSYYEGGPTCFAIHPAISPPTGETAVIMVLPDCFHLPLVFLE